MNETSRVVYNKRGNGTGRGKFGGLSEGRELTQADCWIQRVLHPYMSVFTLVSRLPSCIWRNFFVPNYCLRSPRIKVGSALERAKYSCDLKVNYFPRRDGYVNLFCTCSAWPYWFLGWVFFLTIVEKVAPRFPESIMANLNGAFFQEMLWSNKRILSNAVSSA